MSELCRAVYIVGGAGVGKSYLMQSVLDRRDATLGDLTVLHETRNKTNRVRLRGHPLSDGGMYLGVMRELHPGTDGMDRASHQTAVEWLWRTRHLPSYILAEGRLLSGDKAVASLALNTELLMVHLVIPEDLHQQRIARRQTNQKATYVASTVTGARNAADRAREAGATVIERTILDGEENQVVEEIERFLP